MAVRNLPQQDSQTQGTKVPPKSRAFKGEDTLPARQGKDNQTQSQLCCE